MRMAGMPEQVISAYERYLEGLAVHNTVAGCIGEAYQRQESIPQGDPVSMMITSLLLRPWIMQMRMYGVKARVLADDMQLVAKGRKHLENFECAFTKTHKHL